MSHRTHRKGRRIILAVLAIAFVAVGLWGIDRVVRFEQLTLAGRVSAAWAVQSLEAHDTMTAATSLRTARRQFSDARKLLGPEWLQSIPGLGRQLDVASDLCTVGVEASTAGVEIAQLLQEAGDVPSIGRLNRVLRLAGTHLDPALTSLARVAQISQSIEPDGLVPQLAEAVRALKRPLAQVEPLLGRTDALLGLERYLFSRQHRFLIVTQDSAELRPSGGSMETFGLIEFGPEGFSMTKYADVADLPDDTLNLPSPPGKNVKLRNFGFADGNWWMDFPTSAKQLSALWGSMKQPRIDGIIAVDVPMIMSLLEVYGPIEVPQSKVPLTAGNLVEQLTYLAQQENHGSARDQRKNAVISLTNELVSRAADLSSDQVIPTIDAFTKGADEKHLQLYLVDPEAQADMVASGWSGAIDAPADTTDLLAVNNGAVQPGRANLRITKTMDYQVELQGDGAARTTLTLGYRKTRLKVPGVAEPELANYVRAHRLPGTVLEKKSSGAFETVRDKTGLPTFGHYFRLDLGTKEVVLATTVPGAVQPVPPGATTADVGTVSRYRLLVAKQADLADTLTTVSVTVPAGWRVSGSNAWFRVTGQQVATRATGSTVTLRSTLTQDLFLDVTLAPA